MTEQNKAEIPQEVKDKIKAYLKQYVGSIQNDVQDEIEFGYSLAQQEIETFKDAYVERNDAYNNAVEEIARLKKAFQEIIDTGSGWADLWAVKIASEAISINQKMIQSRKLKNGQKIKLYFRCDGVISEEERTIDKFNKQFIWTDELIHPNNGKKEQPEKFDRRNGRCVNDNTMFGTCRSIDPQ